ncbi:MAG TPA: head GIN domain-containing protein [Chitinophagaceae bacterium]|nr:head GIN domain-containing protein [Chitinophagaceae bacterium]
MKRIALLTIFACTLMLSCDYIDGERVKGSGNIKTEDRPLTNFSSVSSYGEFDIYLTQGQSFVVRIEAEDNLLPYIETVVENGELKINTKDGYWLSNKRDMKIYVTAPAYSKVQTFGSGNIMTDSKLTNTSTMLLALYGSGDIKADLNAPEVTAEVHGSGNIDLRGETRNFEGNVRGSGDIHANELKAENVTVDIAGSGNADVFASVKLNVDIAGSGEVRYRGEAQVSSDIAGSGSVKKVE